MVVEGVYPRQRKFRFSVKMPSLTVERPGSDHSHTCVALLLPGIPVRLKAQKRPEALSVHGDTLGAKLRRRRRELALRRIDVATTLGVDPKSLTWWERDVRAPFVHAHPKIIEFLGYEPWPPPQTLGEALLAEPRRRGLSVDRTAGINGVDPGTWLRWERGEWKPTGRSRSVVEAFLGMDPKRAFPADVR